MRRERENMDAASEMYSEDWDVGATLDKDTHGKSLRDCNDVLEDCRRKLKRELDQGVTPNEFKRGEALLNSLDAAARGLNAAWQKRHE